MANNNEACEFHSPYAGKVDQWYKGKPGDVILAGQQLVSIVQTGKKETTNVLSPYGGVINKLYKSAGHDVKVGDLLVSIIPFSSDSAYQCDGVEYIAAGGGGIIKNWFGHDEKSCVHATEKLVQGGPEKESTDWLVQAPEDLFLWTIDLPCGSSVLPGDTVCTVYKRSSLTPVVLDYAGTVEKWDRPVEKEAPWGGWQLTVKKKTGETEKVEVPKYSLLIGINVQEGQTFSASERLGYIAKAKESKILSPVKVKGILHNWYGLKTNDEFHGNQKIIDIVYIDPDSGTESLTTIRGCPTGGMMGWQYISEGESVSPSECIADFTPYSAKHP